MSCELTGHVLPYPVMHARCVTTNHVFQWHLTRRLTMLPTQTCLGNVVNVALLTLMRHLDDGAVAATVKSMVGCRCLSIRQLSVLLPEPWQSPQGLIRPYWLFTVSLPPAALCIYTWYATASSITCFRYPVKWTIFVYVIICWLLLHPMVNISQ